MGDYISRDKINEAFDSIWDCADMVFEPDDHCCDSDDCGRCKWLQTKNAIKKKLDHIPPADVRPVDRGRWIVDTIYPSGIKKFHCSVCGNSKTVHEKYEGVFRQNFCHDCGADMRQREGAEE